MSSRSALAFRLCHKPRGAGNKGPWHVRSCVRVKLQVHGFTSVTCAVARAVTGHLQTQGAI